MSSEQRQRAELLRWQLAAKQQRPAVRSAVARSLQTNLDAIEFANFDETSQLKSIFSKILSGCDDVEFRNRNDAVTYTEALLDSRHGVCFLLGNKYDCTGAIKLTVEQIRTKCDDLMRSQGECLRLLDDLGTFGICVFTQEGRDDLPYYVASNFGA